jgi:hypothetical protein
MKHFTLPILMVFFSACAPSTYITGSWKSATAGSKIYRNIFVTTLTGNTVARSTVENDIVTALQKTGVSATKGTEYFPPKFQNDSIPREELLSKVRKTGSDAILTVSLLKKETESRYVRGNYGYAPSAQWMYYGSFWGYYSYWQPYMYSPGYYTQEDVFYIETNLYDLATENLMWSAQSQTYSYDGLNPVSKDFAKMTVDKLSADGLLGKPAKK